MTTLITPQEEHKDLALAIYQEYSGDKSGKVPFRLFLKREDLHPYGSHKGRSIPHMIDFWISKGVNRFAIPSSGNAALAAVLYLKSIATPTELHIYCGLNIAQNKLAKIEKGAEGTDWIRIRKVARPLQELSVLLERENSGPDGQIKIASLRQSTDVEALRGYNSLTEELKSIPDLSEIFIGTSSGTTATALAMNLKCSINIIQTPQCHPIADILGAEVPTLDEQYNDPSKDVSLADAIVDKVAIRGKNLANLIKKSGGGAFIATNDMIVRAQKTVLKHAGISISSNSALSIVGLCEVLYSGQTPNGSVVCMICGD